MKPIRLILLILFVLSFANQVNATSYTWTGTTSSDWGTTTNWSPNGTPMSGDDVEIVSGTNNPLYDGSSGVTNFTMTSGTLDLNGYALQISGVGSFDGGTITNGTVEANSATTFIFEGTLMDCKVKGDGGGIRIYSTTFNDSLIYEKTGSSNNTSNGLNKFNDYVELINSGTGYIRMGNLYPDTFYNQLRLVSENSSISIAQNTEGTLFDDTVTVKCKTGDGIYLGSSTASSMTLTASHIIQADTFSTGILRVWGVNQLGATSQNLTLTGDASLYIYYSTFNGSITTSSPRVLIRENVFNGIGDFTKTGGDPDYNNGGNIYNAEMTFTNSGSDELRMQTIYPDTFYDKVTFNSTGHRIRLGYFDISDTTLFADTVVFNSDAFVSNNISRRGHARFGAAIILNRTDGSIDFGDEGGVSMFSVGATLTTGSNYGGRLDLLHVIQEGSTPQNLEFTSGGILEIDTCVFNGTIDFKSPRLIVGSTTFNDTTRLEKTGSGNDVHEGDNTFNGITYITNSSSSTIYLADTDSDDFNDDVHFTNSGGGDLYPGYNGNSTFEGNITTNGGSLIHFGAGGTAPHISIMDGNKNQLISGTTTEIRFKELKVNKEIGEVRLRHDVVVTDTLHLVNGNIVTDTNHVVLNDNSKVIGVADTSYVDGNVKKIGDDAFIYPVGKNNHYRPIGISAPSSTSAEFVANYYEMNSDWSYSHSNKDGTIDDISRNEFWKLERTATTNTVSVTLYWDTITSCGFDSIDSLQVITWNGSQWKDLGNGGTSGDTISGNIVSNVASTWYNVFALGTKDEFDCNFDINELPYCGDMTFNTYTDTINHLPDSLIPYKFFDRFGNKYGLADFAFDTTSALRNGELRNDLLCGNTGYFVPVFENGWEGNLSVVQQAEALDVLCQLFTDLSEFIEPVDPNTEVYIWIRAFDSPGLNPPPTVGAGSSSIYCVPINPFSDHDVIDGQVWRTINSGTDAYVGTLTPLFLGLQNNTVDQLQYMHGFVTFNFIFLPWNTDLASTAGSGEFDLYSIALHELGHILGIASLIGCDGTSRLLGLHQYYSRYDLFLEDANSNNLITNSGNCEFYDYQFNSSLTATSILSPQDTDCIIDDPGCNFGNTTCSTAVVFAGNTNEAVYTPNCYENGSSLSHFEDVCHSTTPYNNDEYYVMSERGGTGSAFTKRFFKEEERQALCDLGYDVETSYGNSVDLTDHTYTGGSCPRVPVVGVNDGIDENGILVYTTTSGTALTISAFGQDGFLTNDYNADDYTCLESHIGIGSITNQSASGFDYTPSGAADRWHVLKYIPLDDQDEQGNVTYIVVYVLNSETCCPTSCNLVVNGDFESSIATQTSPLDCGPFDAFNNLSCWYNCGSSPDLFSRTCTSRPELDIPVTSYSTPSAETWNNGANNNDHFVGLHCGYESYNSQVLANDNEAIQTTLCEPIEPGMTYNFKMWVRVANTEFLNEDVPLEIKGATGMVAPYYYYDPSVGELLYTENVTADNVWHQIDVDFTYYGSEPLTQLIIAVHSELLPVPEPTGQISTNARYLYIDDVELYRITSCCLIEDEVDNQTWTGGSSLGDLTGITNNIIQNETFIIDGTLTISEDLTLDGCTIAMATGASISISPQYTLTITNSTHIYACDEMWDGIALNTGGEIIINGSSLIEDAVIGLSIAPGSDYDIDFAVFNKNYIHIVFLPPTVWGSWNPGAPSGTITNSYFLCQATASVAFPPSSNSSPFYMTLLPPYDSPAHKTYMGILKYSNFSQYSGFTLTVGDVSEGNLFENANFGIYNYDGGLNSYDNTFYKIIGDNNCSGDPLISGIYNCGAAINSIYAEDIDISEGNTFDNTTYGVYSLYDSDDITIEDNTFDYNFFGVRVAGALEQGKNIFIRRNMMEHQIIGVYCYDNPDANIEIGGSNNNGNTIQVSPITSLFSLGGGIGVEEINPLPTTTSLIQDNTITNVITGIGTGNTLGFNYIFDNDVTLYDHTIGDGIVTRNAIISSIFTNTVDGVNNNDDQNGIRVVSGSEAYLICNTTEFAGKGIHVENAITFVGMAKNEMNDNERGFQLTHSTAFDVGTSSIGLGNNWEDNNEYDTYTDNTYAGDKKIYYSSAGAPYEPLSNDADQVFWEYATQAASGGWGVSCPPGSGVRLYNTAQQKSLVLTALADTVTQPTYYDELKWARQANLYISLTENDSVLNSDTTITNFFDSCRTANIGQLVRANFAFGTGAAGKGIDSYSQVEDFLDTLDNMTTSIVPEDALRDVLVIALEEALDTATAVDSTTYWVIQELEDLYPDSTFGLTSIRHLNYTDNQIDSLKVIAAKCPYEYGPAVYIARAMLSRSDSVPYPYVNACEPFARLSENPDNAAYNQYKESREETIEISSRMINVYPNPAQEVLFVELSLSEEEEAYIELWSIDGAKVYGRMLNSSRTKVDVSQLNSGIYFYSIFINDEPAKTGKQIIVR